MARTRQDPLLGRSLSTGGRRRRLGLWLLVFLALVAALVHFSLHRSPLPSAPPHALAPPQLSALPPTLSVCWVETGRLFDVTASGLLIRHPRGNVLLDTGDSSHFKQDISGEPWDVKLAYRLFPGAMQPSLPLPQALRAAGVDPASLKGIIISHLHVDHLGGALDLSPALPIWTRAEELAFAREKRATATIHVLPVLADALAQRGVVVHFKAVPYETFDESSDIFGDGSVVLVKLDGHTPGSLGAFINLGPGRRLFHVGDAADTLGEVERSLSKRRLFELWDVDEDKARQTLAKLTQLHEMDPGLTVIPAHDRGAYEHAFGGAPRCIP